MPPARPRPRYLLGAHAALLTFVGGYTAYCAFVFHTPDANIGLGLGLDALAAIGTPWTLPVVSNAHLTSDSTPFVAVAAGGAVLNLVLHVAVSSWWRARAARRHPRPAGRPGLRD